MWEFLFIFIVLNKVFIYLAMGDQSSYFVSDELRELNNVV